MIQAFRSTRPWARALRLAAVMVVLGAASSVALAGGPSLAADPVAPSANQPFDVVYTLDGCGDTFPAYLPSKRTVEVEGNTIRVTVAYAEQICFEGQPYAPAYDWSIGPFPEGNYDLVLQGYSPNGDPTVTFVLASTTVTIAPPMAAPTPAVIPSTGLAGNFALLALLVLVGLLSLPRSLLSNRA